MDTNMDSETKLSKLHPLTAAAAVAVILVSVTGIAAMTGLLPDFSKTTEPTNLALAEASQPATTAVSPAPAETTPAKKPLNHTIAKWRGGLPPCRPSAALYKPHKCNDLARNRQIESMGMDM